MKSKIEEKQEENKNEQINYGAALVTGISLYVSAAISLICYIIAKDKYSDQEKEICEESDILHPTLVSFSLLTVILIFMYKYMAKDKLDYHNNDHESPESTHNYQEKEVKNLSGQIEEINDSSIC